MEQSEVISLTSVELFRNYTGVTEGRISLRGFGDFPRVAK